MSEYLDPLFPAEQSSLYWDNHHGPDSELIEIYKDEVAGWFRPYNLLHKYQKVNKTLPKLFDSKGINVSDSGSLGSLHDGWFLGAALSLAEYPAYIKKLFLE